MAHLHSIYDSDLHFVIDPDTRVITNQMENKNSVIQFDHNSERLTFELPRYIEEHDMLTCNRVEVHYLNIEAKSGDQNIGIYEVQDLQVSPHDDKVVICSWLVSNNATHYAGTLNFVLRFACVTGEVDYVWNTAVYKNFAIQNGLYNAEPIAEQYADVLAEWYQSLFTASDDGVTNIQEARAAAITAVDMVADERIADIEQAGSDVIASLPEDYLEMLENMAPPIVETATGETIAIRDSADRKLRGLTLYGKSTQDGTPTPEAPVEIESVVEPTVRVCGKNLFNINAINSNSSITNNGDGTLTVSKVVSQPSPVFKKVCPFLRVGDVATFTLNSPAVDETNPEADLAFMYLTGAKVSWKNGHTKTITQEMLDGYIYFYSSKDANGNGVPTVISEIQVELGSVATAYEPYTEQTIPLTRTLPGIPVASGGNYTDENGQQWVCDEVDFGRGVYVQRCFTETLEFRYDEQTRRYNATLTHPADSSLGVGNGIPVLCDILPFNAVATVGVNGVRVATTSPIYAIAYYEGVVIESATLLYPLATPIETALTPEELAAYTSLRSNYPNTSVLNDGGAGMAVSYVADTKLYIDKKLAE